MLFHAFYVPIAFYEALPLPPALSLSMPIALSVTSTRRTSGPVIAHFRQIQGNDVRLLQKQAYLVTRIRKWRVVRKTMSCNVLCVLWVI